MVGIAYTFTQSVTKCVFAKHDCLEKRSIQIFFEYFTATLICEFIHFKNKIYKKFKIPVCSKNKCLDFFIFLFLSQKFGLKINSTSILFLYFHSSFRFTNNKTGFLSESKIFIKQSIKQMFLSPNGKKISPQNFFISKTLFLFEWCI